MSERELSERHYRQMAKELWGEFDGWTYWHYGADMRPDDLPTFASLITIWQGKRNGRLVPSWDDFDFYDFKGWHGWLNIYEVTYDPFDYTVRLAGTNVDELYGQSTQNFDRTLMNQVYAETEVRDRFDEESCRQLKIAHITGPLNILEKTYRSVEYLELPLSADGMRATHTIEAVLPLKDL